MDAIGDLDPLNDSFGEVVEVEPLSDEEECHEDKDTAFESSTSPVDKDAKDNSDDD